MSTNYYVRTADTMASDEGVHLGKTAAGHPFMFRGHPDLGITTYEAWLSLARSGQIVTEYEAEVTLDELVATIEDARTRWGRSVRSWTRDDEIDDQGHRFILVEFC